MPKNSSKSTASGLFKLFILACVVFVGYGVYVYIQDTRDNQLSISQSTQDNNQAADQTDSKETSPSEEDQASNTGTDEGFQQLDRQVEREIKDKLIQEMGTETPTPTPDSSNGFVSVTFVQYNQVEKTLSLGVGFSVDTNESAETCQITIQSGSHRIQQETPARNQSTSEGGCRFNNINLTALPDPSSSQAWEIKISVRNQSGTSLSTLSTSVNSSAGIDQLNN